jgi:hypothetical protein
VRENFVEVKVLPAVQVILMILKPERNLIKVFVACIPKKLEEIATEDLLDYLAQTFIFFVFVPLLLGSLMVLLQE